MFAVNSQCCKWSVPRKVLITSPSQDIDSLSHLPWCCNSNSSDSLFVQDTDSLSQTLVLNNSMSLDVLQVQDSNSFGQSSLLSSNASRFQKMQSVIQSKKWLLKNAFRTLISDAVRPDV